MEFPCSNQFAISKWKRMGFRCMTLQHRIYESQSSSRIQIATPYPYYILEVVVAIEGNFPRVLYVLHLLLLVLNGITH